MPVPTQDRPHAPVLFFDGVSSVGHISDVITVTLTNELPRSAEGGGGRVQVDLVVEAYLRTNLRAAIILRDALNKVILAATPIEGGEN